MTKNPDKRFTEDVRLHLSFIENVIGRMNSNAFSMKGWMIAIVSALCAIYASNTKNPDGFIFFIIAIIAVIIFWCLDAYYLRMERQFRSLYKKIKNNPVETDFSMSREGLKESYWKALWSPSNWILYCSVLVVLGAAIYLISR